MATDKPRITAYVRQDLFDKFNEFCQEYEVKHSKGIELVLAEYFTGDKPDVTLNPLSNMGLSESRVKTLIREQLESDSPHSYTSDLPNDVITKDNLSDSLSNLPEDTLRQIVSNAVGDLLDVTPEALTKLVTTKTNSAIATLKNELQPILDAHKETEEMLGKVRSLVSELEGSDRDEDILTITRVDKKSLEPIFKPSENAPEATEKPSQETSQVKSVKAANSEGSYPHQLLTKKEAYASAQQRGYKSSITAFAQWFRDHKGETLHGIQKHRERGKYIDTGF